MRESLLPLLACPRCRGKIKMWDVRDELHGLCWEGTLTCKECDAGYPVHGGIPVMVPPGNKARDWMGEAFTGHIEKMGLSAAMTALAEGSIDIQEHGEFDRALSELEWREGDYRGSADYWDTLSSNPLVHAQLEALDIYGHHLEEMWMRAGVHFAECVVDIGAGWGGMTRLLAAHMPSDGLLVALDTSYLALKTLQGRMIRDGITNVFAVAGDACCPPLAKGVSDTAVSWFGLGATPFFTKALTGLKSILGPGKPIAFAASPVLEELAHGVTPAVLEKAAKRLDMPRSARDMLKGVFEAGYEDGELLEGSSLSILSARTPLL